MSWQVRLSKEVHTWYDKLPTAQRAIVQDRLADSPTRALPSSCPTHGS
jgi:mRNA-degrading endonuclease RelE of RelBE toxin-antitoxin system